MTAGTPPCPTCGNPQAVNVNGVPLGYCTEHFRVSLRPLPIGTVRPGPRGRGHRVKTPAGWVPSDADGRPLATSYPTNLFGGMAPHVAGSDTSAAAAVTATKTATTKQARILELIRHAGEHGMTCDEVEQVLPYWPHTTISARIRELVLLEQIVDTGRRRTTRYGRPAAVYETRYPNDDA